MLAQQKASDEPQGYRKVTSTSVIPALISGGIAGAIAKTVIAPLDRTKITFQVSASKPYSLKYALGFIKETYYRTGFLSLYRGNSAMMARVIPYAAIQFAAFEELARLLEGDEKKTISPLNRFLCGSLAAMTATCITYPLDLARAKLAMNPQYSSLRAVFYEDFCKFGIHSFYRGIFPTLAGMIPYAGASFYVYGTLKINYKEITGVYAGPFISVLFGALSGIIGQSLSYPFDIVRRRMQTDRIPKGQGVLKTMLYIAKSEGIVKGLYKGLSMNWIKGPIATGIVFASYEEILAYTTWIYRKL